MIFLDFFFFTRLSTISTQHRYYQLSLSLVSLPSHSTHREFLDPVPSSEERSLSPHLVASVSLRQLPTRRSIRLHSSPNIFRVVQVACWGALRFAFVLLFFCLGSLLFFCLGSLLWLFLGLLG